MSDIVTEIVGQPSEPAAENPQVQEQAPVAPPTQPKEDPEFSSRFAALSRKEKYLQDQATSLKQKEEQYNQVEALKAKIKENPAAVLEHYGLSLDDLILASLGAEAPPPTTESQIEMLRKEIEGFKTAAQQKEENAAKAAEEAYQNSINEAIVAHQLKITDHLSKNVDKYELINLQGAQDLVWEVTEAHYDATDGEILTPEQAADKVEAYLEEQTRKALSLSRFKAKETTQETDSGSFMAEQVRPVEKPKTQTLTSEFVRPATPSERPSALDPDESKKRAAQLLKWT